MNHKLDTDTQVFFYEQDFYVLSNFSAFQINWKGWHFATSEHAYHWEKFAGKTDLQFIIRESTSAHAAFKNAEAHKQFRIANWDEIKVAVMYGILRAKAAQHEYVRRKLLETGDRELMEDSWRDDYWGWGPNRDGQNMLGKLWMKVRADLCEQMQSALSEPPFDTRYRPVNSVATTGEIPLDSVGGNYNADPT
jgi:ribA/ribD-fused uncharacterized protein